MKHYYLVDLMRRGNFYGMVHHITTDKLEALALAKLNEEAGWRRGVFCSEVELPLTFPEDGRMVDLSQLSPVPIPRTVYCLVEIGTHILIGWWQGCIARVFEERERQRYVGRVCDIWTDPDRVLAHAPYAHVVTDAEQAQLRRFSLKSVELLAIL